MKVPSEGMVCSFTSHGGFYLTSHVGLTPVFMVPMAVFFVDREITLFSFQMLVFFRGVVNAHTTYILDF